MANGSEKMSEKRDILEYPIEDLDVPSAIRLMMQAASATGVTVEEGNEEESDKASERLAELCEKLEARVEDELEKVKVAEVAPDEPEEEPFEDAAPADTHLVMEDDEVKQVVHKGVVFGKLCNQRVTTHPISGESTTCIKQWDHESLEHEDENGGIR